MSRRDSRGFADLPHDIRMDVRRLVDEHGGEVHDYSDDGVIIAVPNGDAHQELQDALRAMLMMQTRPAYLFPLGTDRAPASLRWACRYAPKGTPDREGGNRRFETWHFRAGAIALAPELDPCDPHNTTDPGVKVKR